ncbi:MAG TPA: nuclear transport factor 2 family protein [Solirubrobacterales bacterium]|jgi:ketosteroid isomerase-like protein|nr:nuclear transport factor 2 family protein [Solirubrobacterales bacterium]
MGANADTVKSGWDAFADGDMDAAVSTTSEQARIVIPESLPWGGTYTGPAGFKEMIGKFLSNFDEVHPEPQQFLEADGGHVLVTVSGTGTTKSGNELGGDSIWLYKVDDGEISHAEFYGDTATAVEALR